MAAGHIQLAADGSGKDVDTNTLTSTEAGTPTVHRQIINIGDDTVYANVAQVTAPSTAVVAADNALAVGLHPSSPLPAGTSKIGTVDIATAAAVAKGTQGANAVPTQDLHDSGRNVSNLFMVIPVVTTTAEVMMSLTGYKGGVAVTTTATPAVVTSGKTLRIQSILMTYIGTATAGQVKFTLRANLAGVAVIGSPLVAAWEVGQTAAVAGVSQTVQLTFEDGMEFAAGTGLAIGMQGLVAPATGTAVGYGQIAIHGYEY